MSLTVGVDSYVTIEEATEYLSAHYPSTDERMQAWGELSESDREVFLRRACDSLNCLAYRGETFEALQPLAFPRYFYPDGVMSNRKLIAPLASVYPELEEVPREVKSAQIEEAFELACPSEDTEKSDALSGAVQSYTIGHLSETFRQAGNGTVESALKSGKAQKLIRQYTEGAYEIF